MPSWALTLLREPHAYDLPNWFVLLFSIIVWPLVLIWWQRRRVTSVHGLEVHFSAGAIHIGPDPVIQNNPSYPAINIQIQNHTGSVVYINGTRILRCSRKFPVTLAANRDVATNSYHLKFNDGGGRFLLREITLQTNQAAQTVMPECLLMLGECRKNSTGTNLIGC
jgi:hypothetical protein